MKTKTYAELFLQYQPRISKTKTENNLYINLIKELKETSNQGLPPDLNDFLALLELLVKDYENQHCNNQPHKILQRLMHEHKLHTSAVANIFCGYCHALQAIHGDVRINRYEAEQLASLFNVSPQCFLMEWE